MRTIGRRRFVQTGLAVAGAGALAGCGLVSLPGQRSTGPRRIGYLEAGTNPSSIEEFRAGMRDLGHVEGQTYAIEHRDAEGILERLPEMVTELIDLHIEVLIAYNNPAFIAASQVTSTLPIVAAGGDVVGPGLVTNVARPGGNITGVSTNATAAYGKRVELLHETVPSLSHLAVVVDSSIASVRWIEPAALALHLRLTSHGIRDLDGLPAVLATAKADGADAVVVVSGGVLGGGGNPRIGAEVLGSRLPAIAESAQFARSGGLMALGTNGAALTRRSAAFVDKILKGSKPGDLPIDQATSFDLFVNMATARTLGLTVPPSVLQQATEIIH